MSQTNEDFQLILKTFEINKKTILDEIKKLQYNLRTATRSRSRSGSYKLTRRAKDLFKHVQAEIDRAMVVMVTFSCDCEPKITINSKNNEYNIQCIRQI